MRVSRFLGSLFNGSTPEPGQGAVPAPEDELQQLIRALDALQYLVRSNGRRIPTSICSQFSQILDIFEALIPYMEEHQISTEQQVLSQSMLGDYLATPLKKYLAAEDEHRTEHSKTTVLLSEQLTLLHEVSQDLNSQIRSGATTELAVFTRFLNDKFEPSMLSPGDLQ